MITHPFTTDPTILNAVANLGTAHAIASNPAESLARRMHGARVVMVHAPLAFAALSEVHLATVLADLTAAVLDGEARPGYAFSVVAVEQIRAEARRRANSR